MNPELADKMLSILVGMHSSKVCDLVELIEELEGIVKQAKFDHGNTYYNAMTDNERFAIQEKQIRWLEKQLQDQNRIIMQLSGKHKP